MSNAEMDSSLQVGCNKFLTPEEKDQIVTLYLDGKTFFEIAKQLGCKQRFVNNCIENVVLTEIDNGSHIMDVLEKYRMSTQHYEDSVKRRNRRLEKVNSGKFYST